MSHREQILSKVQSIGTIPAAATEVVRLVRDPDVTVVALTRAIELDPWLTSNVLRLANSAFFGTPRSAATVKEAIVRLGMNRVFQLVVASVVAPMEQQPVKGYDLPAGALWEHSVAVAVGTAELASALSMKAPDHAFTAGLLHDIGKVVLGTFLDVDAEPIMALAYEQAVSFEQAERQVLGIDHAEVGAVLLESWKLPPSIVSAVRCHHRPEDLSGADRVVDLVHVADALALMTGLGAGSDGLNYRVSDSLPARLPVTTNIAESVTCRMLSALDDLRVLFSASAGR